MTKVLASQRRSEGGFTLVELAIVMVIIGLLIGGILKGQELIATAKVGATVSQIKALDAAINTFQEKYAAYPGDMRNPNTRLPDCTSATCNVANTGANGGNMQIVNVLNNLTAAPAAGSEGTRAFSHLSKADLLSGVDADATGTPTFGALLPVVKGGGGMWISYMGTAVPAGTNLTGGRHYAMLNGTPVAMAATTGGFNSIMAAQLDRKMDDGRANAGGAQTIGTGCSAAGVYAEATPGAACAMYVRILN